MPSIIDNDNSLINNNPSKYYITRYYNSMNTIINEITQELNDLQNKINTIDAIQTNDSEILNLCKIQKDKLLSEYNNTNILLNSLQSQYNRNLEIQNFQFTQEQQDLINSKCLSHQHIDKLKNMNCDDRNNFFRILSNCKCHFADSTLKDILLN
jgi:hypothetical protein